MRYIYKNKEEVKAANKKYSKLNEKIRQFGKAAGWTDYQKKTKDRYVAQTLQFMTNYESHILNTSMHLFIQY